MCTPEPGTIKDYILEATEPMHLVSWLLRSDFKARNVEIVEHDRACRESNGTVTHHGKVTYYVEYDVEPALVRLALNVHEHYRHGLLHVSTTTEECAGFRRYWSKFVWYTFY